MSSSPALNTSQILILTPLGILVGALSGVVSDLIQKHTITKPLRMLQKVLFPFIFFAVVSATILSVSWERALNFSADEWKNGRINARMSMMEDLKHQYNFVGMGIQEVESLLGPSEERASPWHRLMKMNSRTINYDLGHRSAKYGSCFVLYYDGQGRIIDTEETRYKFW